MAFPARNPHSVILIALKENIPLSAEENKATFRRYVEEVGNEGNLDLVDEIFDSYLSHHPDGHTEERGSEDVKRFMSEFRQAFPDFHSTIEDQIAEGDKVVVRWTMPRNAPGQVPGHRSNWQADRGNGDRHLPVLR